MRFAPSFLAFAGLTAAATLGTMVACSESTGVGGIPPVTGIVIRAESLTQGRGCGTGASQVFRYAAVVYGMDGAGNFTVPRAANVFDCFTDGTFVQLAPVNGSLDFRVDVFVYTQPAYASQKATIDNASAPEPPLPTDANPNPVAPALAVKTALEGTTPTWTTSCTATQQPDVRVLAACNPLAAGTGGLGGQTDAATDGGGDAGAIVTLSLGSFPNAEGGTYRCSDQFTKTRVRPRVGGTIGEAVDLRCDRVDEQGTLVPVVFEVNPALAPANYEIDVGLVRADDTVLGQTICRAGTTPGLKSSAVCDPVP